MSGEMRKAGLAVALAMTISISNAETPSVDTDLDNASAGLNEMAEIVVTAQRKEESLARTPVSISVLGGDALAQRAIVTESDLQSAVPGLGVKASSGSNQLNYVIRGQSLDSFSGVRPGVLPY